METNTIMPLQTNHTDIDTPWVPTSPQATSALRHIKSAPVRSQPTLAYLKKTSTRLDWRRPDFGVLDVWVDDGTCGNLDSVTRSMRFSVASSKISSLFTADSRDVCAVVTIKPEDEDAVDMPWNAVGSQNPPSFGSENQNNDGAAFATGCMESVTEKFAFSEQVMGLNGRRVIARVPKLKLALLDVKPLTSSKAAYSQSIICPSARQSSNKHSVSQDVPPEVVAEARVSSREVSKSTLRDTDRASSPFVFVRRKDAAAISHNRDVTAAQGRHEAAKHNNETCNDQPLPPVVKTGSYLRNLITKVSSRTKNPTRRESAETNRDDETPKVRNVRSRVVSMLKKLSSVSTDRAQDSSNDSHDAKVRAEDDGVEQGMRSSPQRERPRRLRRIREKLKQLISTLAH